MLLSPLGDDPLVHLYTLSVVVQIFLKVRATSTPFFELELVRMVWVKEIVPLDHNLARFGDLFSQVLVAVVIVRPMRVPLFLKLNEG